MNSMKSKVGLLIVVLIVGVAYGVLTFLAKPRANAALDVQKKATTVANNVKQVQNAIEETPEDLVNFENLVVDPFLRTQAVPEMNETPTGPAKKIDRNPVPNQNTGPVIIEMGNKPPVLQGNFPVIKDTNPVPNAGNPDKPEPVSVAVYGIIVGEKTKAFVSVAGGAKRAIGPGTDLGDGITVTAISSTALTVVRNGQTATLKVGQEGKL